METNEPTHSNRALPHTWEQLRTGFATKLVEYLYSIEINEQSKVILAQVGQLLNADPDLHLILYSNHLAYDDQAFLFFLHRLFLDPNHQRTLAAVGAYDHFEFTKNPLHAIVGNLVCYLFDTTLLNVVQQEKKGENPDAEDINASFWDKISTFQAALIAPEGRRSKTGILQEAKGGIMKIAEIFGDVVFVPFGIEYPDGLTNLRIFQYIGINFGVKVQLNIGQPIICTREHTILASLFPNISLQSSLLPQPITQDQISLEIVMRSLAQSLPERMRGIYGQAEEI
ncbi:hypothetical protein JW766_02315 [Candidatus Dojkabacteria bacterium]|nr:hypothetical protein [Candidatus Dojkabacteria bacterium]